VTKKPSYPFLVVTRLHLPVQTFPQRAVSVGSKSHTAVITLRMPYCVSSCQRSFEPLPHGVRAFLIFIFLFWCRADNSGKAHVWHWLWQRTVSLWLVFVVRGQFV